MASTKFDWASVGGRPAGEPQQSQDTAFDWSSVGGRPAPKKAPSDDEYKSNLNKIKKEVPIAYKIAESLKDSRALKKAGNIAGHFNRAVEGTGLPSLAKGFLGTGVDIGRGLANLIPGVNIPKQNEPELNVNPYIGQGAETIGSLGMGLPVYRGYQAAKKGIEAIPHAKHIPELIRNLLAGGATGAAISPEDRGLGALLGGGAELAPATLRGAKSYLSNRNVPARERDLYKAMMEHGSQESEEKALKDLASHKFGKSNPESLLLNAEDKARQLEGAQAFQRNRMPEEKMLPGQQLIPEAEHAISNVNNVLKQTLGEGESHGKKLSEHIVNAIEGEPVMRPHPKTGLPREVREGGLREEIGKKYDALEEKLPNVEIPGTPNMQAVEKELEQLVGSKSNLSDTEKDTFRKALAATHPSGNSKTINGKSFFRAYRSLKKMEGNQRSKAFGLSPKEHDEWIERANKTKQTYEDMEKIIDKHFPEGTIKQLHEINHEYSTKVAPLHENPAYQYMLKHKNYKGNIIEALEGKTKGNVILNNLIQKNPELSRLALGHSFAENPEKLLKPNKSIEPYANANPEIQRLMQYQKEAHGQLESAKHNAEMHKQIEMIPKLTKEIGEQREIAKRLKRESEATSLSKVEVAKKKIEHENAQKRVNALKNKLLGTVLVAGGSYVTKKIRE